MLLAEKMWSIPPEDTLQFRDFPPWPDRGGRKHGNLSDNAFAESFTNTLKRKKTPACGYETPNDVIGRLPRFLDFSR